MASVWLPTDAWTYICRFFVDDPKAVWSLVYVCKQTRRAFFRVFGRRYDSWVEELELCSTCFTGADPADLTRRPCADAWLNADARCLSFEYFCIAAFARLGSMPQTPDNMVLLCLFLPPLTLQQRAMLSTCYADRYAIISDPERRETYLSYIMLVRCALHHNILLVDCTCVSYMGTRFDLSFDNHTILSTDFIYRTPSTARIFFPCTVTAPNNSWLHNFHDISPEFRAHITLMEKLFLECYGYSGPRTIIGY
jgi:hypothetical protein